ncbi:hypothetical protein CXF81_08575 [Glaciecola sp. 33A]|nr:hypothetical protein CXF81_08575 [Glaciecola sp. 33A]
MNEATANTSSIDTFLYYLLFDVAIISFITVIYVIVKLIFKVLSKNPKNYSQYHSKVIKVSPTK